MMTSRSECLHDVGKRRGPVSGLVVSVRVNSWPGRSIRAVSFRLSGRFRTAPPRSCREAGLVTCSATKR